MKEFIRINEMRLRRSTIKRYTPTEKNRITVYYSASRNKVDFESFSFVTSEDRDNALFELDLTFLT